MEKEQQIIDAIERLVGLLQGEEGEETKREALGELVSVKAAAVEEGDLDVVEV